MNKLNRRDFVRTTLAAGAALGVHSSTAIAADTKSAASKITVAVMGVNGRGLAHVNGFAKQALCEVAYVCDVDSRARDRAAAALGESQTKKPQAIANFQTALDDKSLDALIIAAPDHWHAPAAILAASAGKHVYVEKPCCHNPREGELLVAAAQKHDRIVTMGNQRRSWPGVIEAMEKLKSGAIGRVILARGWYNNRRNSIGKGNAIEVPAWLDWTHWQGPAPERPFRDNIVHYHWHWFWHWGTGELGNNGVHGLDLCRWGLGVDFPERVSTGGGKYRHDDDQETPDTQVVTYDFPGRKLITWQGLSWTPRGFEGTQFGVSFHGEAGSLVLLDTGYKIYDDHEKLVEEKTSSGGGDAGHQADFLAAIREHRPANAAIDGAYKSTFLCLIGNIAYRTGRVLNLDPATGRIKNDPDAEKLWTREYRPGFEPKV